MSLRTRIVLLVLLATFMPAALLGMHLFEDRRDDIAQATQSLNALAVYASADLDEKVSGTVQLLHGLSRAADLDAADKARCSVFLSDVLRRYPQYTGLLTIRPDGQLHCDSLATGRTLDLNDRAYFRQARTSTEPAFEVVFGRLTGIAVLQVAYPARDSDGNLKYVLLASVNLARFNARIATSEPLPGLEAVLWDNKGTVMARHPDSGPKELAGTSLAQSELYRFASEEHPGTIAELAGPDGTLKIWVVSNLPAAAGSGLRITLGVPRGILLARADHDLRQALSLLAGVTLFAFAGALLFAELGIRRQLARIMAAARRQGAGDANARIGEPLPRGELGELMTTLDAAAASVQAQQVEIEHKTGELQGTNRMLRMLSAINSTIVRVRNREELLTMACRIATEEGQFAVAWAGLRDRDANQLRPMAWQGVDREYVDAVLRSATDRKGVVGLVLEHGRAVVVNDVAAGDARLVMGKAAQELGSRSLAAFPLIVAGEVVGVLGLHAREAGFFDAQEMKLLDELAGDVSFALEYIEKSEKLDYLAYYDSLTGLANRALFHDRLSQFLSLPGQGNRQIALVLADVERFRTINDSFGRPAGDALIKQVAGRAGRQVADARWLARIGVDLFATVIPDEAELEGVARRVERLHREIFGKPFQVGDTELRVAARFGIALYPGDGTDADTLFRHAEAALKKAKASGERYLFYDPRMTERVAEKLALESRLRLALENNEFVLHYQPKVHLETRRITGLEALIRWNSPQLGLVPPMSFIPLLEETGLILQVGAWALKQASLDHREWTDAGLQPPRLAVNVSPIQLRQRDFVRSLALAIQEGVKPPGIDVEITESLVMEDIDGNIGKLQEVRALGLDIAIDDFGTGYSSLAYLAKLPVQTLKIDRSFIITMLNDRDTMTVVSTIISLAHSLRLTVVAEGVDAEEQAKVLRLLRCDQMQGFLYSPPVSKADLVKLLLRERETAARSPALHPS